MTFRNKFTFLKKGESKKEKKNRNTWVIDETKCLSINEVEKLRAVCHKNKLLGLQKDKFSPVRIWFMIELGLNAGLRVQEMALLKHGNLIIEGSKSSIVVKGKGNKKRSVWIGSKFKKDCLKYINYKKRFKYNTDEDSYLLNNLKGERISKRALQKFFKQLLSDSEISHHYSIHCLRHTYSTFLLKASNHNYRFVQKQLGHSSIKTTQIYASIIESEGKIAIENLYK